MEGLRGSSAGGLHRVRGCAQSKGLGRRTELRCWKHSPKPALPFPLKSWAELLHASKPQLPLLENGRLTPMQSFHL